MKRLLIFLLAVASLQISIAQDTLVVNTLKNQFNEMKSNSNNYQVYKVVRETTLDAFWKSVQDSLAIDRRTIAGNMKEESELRAKVGELQAMLNERDASLQDQEYQIEHMSFLGVALTKSTYITFTWILIAILVVLAFVLFIRYNSANRVTAVTKKEHEALQIELETHRQRTRENETKLKRELQTELNRVEELKGMIGGES